MAISFNCWRSLLIYCILCFVCCLNLFFCATSTFVCFLPIWSRFKYTHEGVFISETDKYIVSFFFGDKGLKLSLLNANVYFLKVFFSVKDQYKAQKNSNFYLTIRFTTPWCNWKLLFQDANFFPAALTTKD